MDKIVYFGEVRDNGVHIFNRKRFDAEIQVLNGKQVEITIRKKRRTRSLEQNAYYWGVVVPMIRKGLNDAGWKFGLEQSHELMKAKFLQIEIVNEDTGEIIKSIGTTTNISTSEMMDYIASVQQWAAEFLSITIPDPGEQLKIEA